MSWLLLAAETTPTSPGANGVGALVGIGVLIWILCKKKDD